MPQIIQLIKDDSSQPVIDDKISCYVVVSTLPASVYAAAKATGKMVLTMGNNALDMCRRYDLDGVVAEIDVTKPLKAQVRPLRDALKHKTLGIIIPPRRHEAMLAGEVEPEFIVFAGNLTPQDNEIIKWYNELFLLPLAIFPTADAKVEGIVAADFIMLEAKNFENFDC